jgi:serine/threonine-protein kinase
MPILTEAERLGTTLDGRYLLRSILGRGGMGVVYAAEHALTGRSVAVKLVRPELASDPRYAERLFREARAAAALQHPNVVDVLDMGALEDGGLYLVLELLEGFDLAAVLDAEGPLALERVLRLIEPVLDALEALHAKGIVHRDLKPSNVFVTRRGSAEVPKLLDFGIAKLRDARGSTTTGRILGTPWYMSPEQAAGDVEAGPEVDVWAVGAMLFECLSGRVPFDGPTPTAVLMNVLRRDAPTLELPEAPHVAEAVRRAMSKGDDRIRSAAALRDALRGAAPAGAEARAAGSPGGALRVADERAVTPNLARTPEPTLTSTPARRRGWGAVVAVVAIVTAAMAAIGWAASREADEPATLEREIVAEEAARPASVDAPVEGAEDVPAVPEVEPEPRTEEVAQTPRASAPPTGRPSVDAPRSRGRAARRTDEGPRADDANRAGDAIRAGDANRAGDTNRAGDPRRATPPSEPTIVPPTMEGTTESRPTEPSLRTRW